VTNWRHLCRSTCGPWGHDMSRNGSVPEPISATQTHQGDRLKQLRRQQHSESQSVRRSARREIFGLEVLPRLRKEHEVRRLTEYQYRIDGVLDIYPTHRCWHLLRRGWRGRFRKPTELAIADIEKVLSGKPVMRIR